MRGKVALTLVGFVAGVGLAKNAYGAVYVLPPDIDQYKQKTDQAYTDLYKNPNSPITQGITAEDREKLEQMSTPNAILKEGADIKKANTAVVQGKAVADGTTLELNIAGSSTGKYSAGGGKVVLKAEQGEWKVVQCSGLECQSLGTWVKMNRQIQAPRCESSSKYGCTKEGRVVQEIYLNAFTGDLKTVDQHEVRTRSCSKYGCGAWGAWAVDKTLKYREGAINLQKAVADGVVQLNVPIYTSANVLMSEASVLGGGSSGGKYD